MPFQFKKISENLKVEDEILSRNINNMFYLSVYVICSECFMLLSFIGIKHKLPEAYQYIYLGMYVFLLLFGIFSTIYLFPRKRQSVFADSERKFLNQYTIVFVLIMMLWGVIIALLDQPVYGQIIAFVTNYVFCACLLLLRPRVFITVQTVPLTCLFLLLPLFQKNSSIILGHYINLAALLIPLTISSYRSYSFFYDNTSNKLKEKEFSEKDELTSLYNRRKMNEYIDQEIINEDMVHSVGILMLDVDYFKKYNDTYGHQKGDSVLHLIGNTLGEMSRKHDIFVARYGGEEFIIIIKNKEREQVFEIAREIKQNIGSLQIPHKTSEISDMLTVSIGLHYGEGKQTDIYGLIKKADDALYEAKIRGRNQIASV